MECTPTAIPEVVVIRPTVFGGMRDDDLESWDFRKFADYGLPIKFAQDNQSRSSRRVLRGLHYQIVQPQGKLVRVVKGDVFDVAVDIRRSSPTFRRWVGVPLSDKNHHSLWVPPGFAHGFLALSDFAVVLCSCTDFWAQDAERAIIWNDPDFGVSWPLPLGEEPQLSAKDAAAGRARDAEYFP